MGLNRLFLALFPDPVATQSISTLAAGLREQHGLTGRLRPHGQLHVMLHWLGDYSGMPETVIQPAGQACAATAARTPSFVVKLDSVLSLRGRPGNHPLVLTGDSTGNSELMNLHRQLAAELTQCQCYHKVSPEFSPRLTLLYDKVILRKEPVVPVTWTAGDIILVHSEVGAGRYHRSGAWPLRT